MNDKLPIIESLRRIGALRRLLPAMFALAAAALLAAGPARAADDFLDVDKAFQGGARMADKDTVEVRFEIAPGYHLYRERFSVKPQAGDLQLGQVDLPAGKPEYDPTFNKTMDVWRDGVTIRVPVAKAGAQARLTVEYQGCADKGLCYPPQTSAVDLKRDGERLQVAAWVFDADASTAPGATAAAPTAGATSPAAAVATTAPAATTAVAASAKPAESEGSAVDRALRSRNLGVIAGVFLVAGLLLSFTPCVLPMVPILSSIIVGQSGPGGASRMRGLSLAAAYSLGMALVYTAFGVVAGLLGEGLAAALQNAWVLGAFAILLSLLSLSMFGVFQFQMPGNIQSRVTELTSKLPGGRYSAVFAMGGLSALIVGPCVAAPLAGALVYISQTRDVWVGGTALFCLAAGMSVPLLLVGMSAGALLPRAGAWMEAVKKLFGVMLLGVALWIVSPVLPGPVLMAILGVGALMLAVHLRAFDSLGADASGLLRVGKGTGLVLAVLGVAQLVGALAGAASPLQPLAPLATARASAGAVTAAAPAAGPAFKRITSTDELEAAIRTAGRPVVLDFYADWCVSCKEMEHVTFSDPAVRARLQGAVLLQADVTANEAQHKALLKRFGLFGPPGVLFFDASGHERQDARVIGFVEPGPFTRSLNAVGL